jgi:hypothetical protein
VATNTTEACKLIEDGFAFIPGEYDDGGKIFRKPKYYTDSSMELGMGIALSSNGDISRKLHLFL